MSLETLKNKKCVVTGAAGFVGSHLVEALIAEGANVVAIDLPLATQWEVIPPTTQRIMCDIRDDALMRSACSGADAVFHLAARVSVPGSIESPLEYHDTNVNGTLSLFEHLRAIAPHARVVIASSAAVYGDHGGERAEEGMRANPKSPYALHKYIDERMAQLWSDIYGMETVALRCFNIYGPRMNPEGPYAGVVGRFLKMKKEGSPLLVTGDGSQTRDFVHVSDVVRGYVAAACSPAVGRGEVINIASGTAVSVSALAALIGGPIEYISPRVEIQHSLADISRARSLLSWEPYISLEKGVSELRIII